MKKLDRPFVLPVTAERRPALEQLTFSGAYKGVTDLVTKWLWPVPAQWVTRWCVRMGMTANQVTAASLVLVIVAGVLFARGEFAWGLVAGWIMTFLDTVDGKLARVTITSTQFGNVFDHGIDLIHPPLWYFAWGVGLALDPPAIGGVPLAWIYWAILAGYVGGRLCEGAFQLFIARFSIFTWRPFDSWFRLVAARRNPNMIMLTVSLALGRPDLGLLAVAVWTVASMVLLLARLLLAALEKHNRVTIRSWLSEIGEHDGRACADGTGVRPRRSHRAQGVTAAATCRRQTCRRPIPQRASRASRSASCATREAARTSARAKAMERRARRASRTFPASRCTIPLSVEAALRDLAGRGVDTIAVSGGDGTVSAVLNTIFARNPFPRLPLLAVLRGGTANMTARDVGLSGRQHRALSSLIEAASRGGEGLTVTKRPVIRIDPGGGRDTIHGMYFAAAAISQGIDYCKRNVHKMGLRGEIGPAVTMARFVVAMARGEREIVAPVPMTVAVDDAPAATFDCEVVHVTTLEQLVLGLRPYWGAEAAPLHYASVRAHPRHWLRALPGLLRGRPNRFVTEANGYESRNAHRLSIGLDTPFFVDGELFSPTPGTPLLLTDGGTADFVTLR